MSGPTENAAIPALTLDTNLLFEYWMQGLKVTSVRQLIALAKQGKIDLAVTARVREDVPHEPLFSKLDELPLLGVTETGTVARSGIWVLGRDQLGDRNFDNHYVSACSIAKQRGKKLPDRNDWDHLHAHFLQKRDYFLTWDRGIICLEPELWLWFRIVVLTPESALEKLEKSA